VVCKGEYSPTVRTERFTRQDSFAHPDGVGFFSGDAKELALDHLHRSCRPAQTTDVLNNGDKEDPAHQESRGGNENSPTRSRFLTTLRHMRHRAICGLTDFRRKALPY